MCYNVSVMYKLLNINNVTEQQVHFYYSLMTEEKRERVDRFRFAKDKKRTVCGEMLARQMIAEQCGIHEEAIRFSVSEHGKPYTTSAAVQFNISHSGDYVLCALSDSPVGADIEAIRPVEERMIRFVCTEKELAYVLDSTVTQEEKLRRFFRVWTAKEAYFKYCGTGITDLKGVSIFDEALMSCTKTFYKDNYVASIFEKPPTEGTPCFGR